MKKQIFILLFATLLINACSKAPGKTTAKMKLSLSGIVNIATGIGSGGALLFGRSTKGELFGKVVSSTEENLDLPNGDWVFYAFMWDSSSTMMNGKVHCGKVPASLNGTDVVLNFQLNNNNCNDPEFSNGRKYLASTFVRFADLFVEECNDVNATTLWYCGADNQGSAVSYRFRFHNFKKGPSTPFIFGPESIQGTCKVVDNASGTDLLEKGLDVNFPSGNGTTPFVGMVEMFLGSTTCDPNEAKGFHRVVFEGGMGAAAGSLNSKVVESTKLCSSITGSALGILNEEKKMRCESYLGDWTGSSCTNIRSTITRFAPGILCSTALVDHAPAIKHLISIPKPVVCDKYLNQSTQIGTSHPFAGGNGSIERPYKICTEWQLNQIGEVGAADYTAASFTLMNDLDMNKADMGPYSRPQCAGVNTNFDRHHNLNSFPPAMITCASLVTSPPAYTGIFNGNGKTISNARISTENSSMVAFVRKLGGYGEIRNLQFKNLESRGMDYVGGVAGYVEGNSLLRNITIKGLDVEGKDNTGADYIGGVAGKVSATTNMLLGIVVKDANVRGDSYLGGIGGDFMGKLSKSSFSGHLDHHANGNYVGGLVGFLQSSSSVEESFSEGLLHATALSLGGIAGHANGTLSNVYSTMSLVSRTQNSNATVGGIAGSTSTASIHDAYFFGNLNHFGGTTPSLAGIYASGSSSASRCWSNDGIAGTGCTPNTNEAAFRDASTFAPLATAKWTIASGALPRLAWESRLCTQPSNMDTIANQITSGRGTSPNPPVVICTPAQLKSIPDSNHNFVLGEDINLSTFMDVDFISTFSGTLNGNGHALYGMNTSIPSDSVQQYWGMIKINNGTIKNLKLYRNEVISSESEYGVGILVGKNNNILSDIEIYHSKLDAQQQTGILAGINQGSASKMTDIHIEGGEIRGYFSVGGVVGLNNGGTIKRVSSRAKITNMISPSSFNTFGGIAGENQGTLDQVSFDGEIDIGNSTATYIKVGGITGNNFGASSVVSNALTGAHATIRVRNVSMAGGIVGGNSGTVSKSLMVGKLVFDNSGSLAPGSSDFSPLIGSDSGSMAQSYFLEKTAVSKLGDSATTTFTGTAPSMNVVVSGSPSWGAFPATANTADLFVPSFGGGVDSLGFIDLTAYATDSFSYSGEAYADNTQLSFFKAYSPVVPTGSKTRTQIANLNTYCAAGFSGPAGGEVCNDSTQFDITFTANNPLNDKGHQRMVDYYLALMNGTTPPANAPVWEFSEGDKYPRLMQLKHH